MADSQPFLKCLSGRSSKGIFNNGPCRSFARQTVVQVVNAASKIVLFCNLVCLLNDKPFGRPKDLNFMPSTCSGRQNQKRFEPPR
ncbi:hypothetical protein TNCT_589121 [Trichonephila clavata]|uniref:Uncharacterized protein n=1 Tax=Trichonephila clavata TaxID=2740835 RepID=A0A8X6I095_TRICU|nr:hypothetical protein TNCT_589121 [Trichonephila clavata]